MGSFANSALSFMLGWMRGAAQWLWRLIDGQRDSGMLAWLQANWLALAIGLCIAGVVIDFMVYLARWRPDLVWRSFIRRLTKGPAQPPMVEDVTPADVQPQPDLDAADAVPELAMDAVDAAAPVDAVADADDQADDKPRARHRRADRYGEGTPYAKVQRVKELLFPEEKEVAFQSYKPSRPLGSKEDTQELNKPYIPPQWQKPEE